MFNVRANPGAAREDEYRPEKLLSEPLYLCEFFDKPFPNFPQIAGIMNQVTVTDVLSLLVACVALPA